MEVVLAELRDAAVMRTGVSAAAVLQFEAVSAVQHTLVGVVELAVVLGILILVCVDELVKPVVAAHSPRTEVWRCSAVHSADVSPHAVVTGGNRGPFFHLRWKLYVVSVGYFGVCLVQSQPN